ncbi:2Fe-2S iron-sulfur cluster-binding protein [soil metagenome]
MKRQVVIEPQRWSFEADDDRPVLDSARSARIAMPKSCRNGTCRTCMCRLQAGSVHYRIEWPGLSAEEKASGYILPCVAYPDSDLLIDVPEARQMLPPAP